MMKYAGIGSRETSPDILTVMEDFAYEFARQAILRTGGAPGADAAFAFGAEIGGGLREIYLPWPGFNKWINNSFLDQPTENAFKLAEQYHPGWKFLKPGAKKLHARNCHEILGKSLNDPVDMVICWTPDGSLDGKGSKAGGTGQALRIATGYEMPVFNIQRPEHLSHIKDAIGDGGIPLR